MTMAGGVFQPEMELVNGIFQPVLKQWTIGGHIKNNMKDSFGPWDERDLSLARFVLQSEATIGNGRNRGLPIDNVPMASLANGLNRWPDLVTGDDHNLTRCVLHALAHPEQNLLFPLHFESVTKLLAPIPLQAKHFDGAIFERFTKGKTPNPPGLVIPMNLQVPSTPSTRQSATPRPTGSIGTQSKVRKAYQSSREQTQSMRASANSQQLLNSSVNAWQGGFQSKANGFQVQSHPMTAVAASDQSPAARRPPNEQGIASYFYPQHLAAGYLQPGHSFAEAFTVDGNFPGTEHPRSQSLPDDAATTNSSCDIIEVVMDLDLGDLSKVDTEVDWSDANNWPNFPSDPEPVLHGGTPEYLAFCNECLAEAPGPDEARPRDQVFDFAEPDEVFSLHNADLTDQVSSHDPRDAQTFAQPAPLVHHANDDVAGDVPATRMY
jgi:hypothetical protein